MNQTSIEKWGNSLKNECGSATFSRSWDSQEIPDSDWGKFGHDWHPETSIKTSGIFFPFFPLSAESSLLISSEKNEIRVKHVLEESSVIPLLSVIVNDNLIDFFVDFFPYNYSHKCGDWNIPIWDYKSPYLLNHLNVLYDVWTASPSIKFKAPHPLYERFVGKKTLFMPRGIFYPTYSMRSLSFKGTGNIKYTKLGNDTSELVTYRWFVPNNWKDKIGWIENGKIVHQKDVKSQSLLTTPTFIDESILDTPSFIPTLLVAQGNNRIEWQPIPLFPKREKGDFFLDSKDLNPKLDF